VSANARAPLGYDVPTFNGIQSLKGSMVNDFTMRPFSSCLVVDSARFLPSFERLSSLVRQSPRAPLGYDVPTFNGIQCLKGIIV
jgi:hypothetical protein